MLWEISGNNLKVPSYLFGTYHFAGSSYLDTLPLIEKIFREVKTVVGEIKMGNEILVAAQLIPHMRMNDQKLNKLLSPQEFEMVNRYLAKVSQGLHLNMFNNMKPAAIQMVLMRHTSPVKIVPEERLMDLYFQQEGEKARKEIIGLETIAEQGKLLFGRPLMRQKKLLIKFVRQAPEQEEQARELFDYYRAGDLNNLEKAFAKYNNFTGKEMDQLMKHRNRKWMQQLPAIMSKGSAFIAVGGGHLPGKFGLLNLLERSGYVIRPLNTTYRDSSSALSRSGYSSSIPGR